MDVFCFLILFGGLVRISQQLTGREDQDPRFIYTVGEDSSIVANRLDMKNFTWDLENGVCIKATRAPDRGIAWEVWLRSSGDLPGELVSLILNSSSLEFADVVNRRGLQEMIEKAMEETNDLYEFEKLKKFLEEVGLEVTQERKESLERTRQLPV